MVARRPSPLDRSWVEVYNSRTSTAAAGVAAPGARATASDWSADANSALLSQSASTGTSEEAEDAAKDADEACGSTSSLCPPIMWSLGAWFEDSDSNTGAGAELNAPATPPAQSDWLGGAELAATVQSEPCDPASTTTSCPCSCSRFCSWSLVSFTSPPSPKHLRWNDSPGLPSGGANGRFSLDCGRQLTATQRIGSGGGDAGLGRMATRILLGVPSPCCGAGVGGGRSSKDAPASPDIGEAGGLGGGSAPGT
mmetsp:Transcript_724/g.1711  ORF Transcript_724/g.1711 Transcript_724/m.1711 type:complete len:253 (+) Transcript_724:440-1198(+)